MSAHRVKIAGVLAGLVAPFLSTGAPAYAAEPGQANLVLKYVGGGLFTCDVFSLPYGVNPTWIPIEAEIVSCYIEGGNSAPAPLAFTGPAAATAGVDFTGSTKICGRGTVTFLGVPSLATRVADSGLSCTPFWL